MAYLDRYLPLCVNHSSVIRLDLDYSCNILLVFFIAPQKNRIC